MENNIYEALKHIFTRICKTDKIDLKTTENRIQQIMGILSLIDKLDMSDMKIKEQHKLLISNALQTLYGHKKELLYGYNDEKLKLVS